jgi:GPI-anchor transamidase subunit K
MIQRGQRLLALLLWLFSGISFASPEENDTNTTLQAPPRPPLSLPQHSSNYAVIVSSSRYWFNYRHNANALSIYQMIRHYGFTDENIILMLADEFAVNPRNPVKNRVFNTATDTLQRWKTGIQRPSLLTDDTEIDYRGEDVTVECFINVLTGRSGNGVLPVLESDENSNVLIYMTGHSGDQFFKFQDVEEATAEELAAALYQMHLYRKYKEVLIMADTCQAFTLGDAIAARRIPNVSVIGSSLRGEHSYAHTGDPVVGLSVIEKYTHYFVQHVRNNHENRTMQEQTVYEAMIEPFSPQKLGANVGMTDANSDRKLTEVPLRDFFANVQSVKFWSSEKVEDNPAKVEVSEKGGTADNETTVVVDDGEQKEVSETTAIVEDHELTTAVRVQLLPEPAVRFTSLLLFPNDDDDDGVVVGDQRPNTAEAELQRDNDERRCAAPGSPDAGQCAAVAFDRRSNTPHRVVPSKPGMEPNDPLFILIVISLFGTVALASRRW